MRQIVLKKSLLNYKALLAGALTIVAVEQIARFLSRPWMVAQIEGIEDKLRIASTSTDVRSTMTVAEYVQSQMWPVAMLSLTITVAAYLLGGYVVGRLANRNYFLNAMLAFVLVIGGSFVISGNGFREQPVIFLAIATVGLLFMFLGCFLGVKLATKSE